MTHYHTGLDLSADNVPVHAIYSGKLVDYIEDPNGIYGNHAFIQHEAKGVVFYSMYAHLTDRADGVEIGQSFYSGQQFAISGNTGNVALHLHLAVTNETGYRKGAPTGGINDQNFYDSYYRVPAYRAYDYSNFEDVQIPYRTGPPFPRYP